MRALWFAVLLAACGRGQTKATDAGVDAGALPDAATLTDLSTVDASTMTTTLRVHYPAGSHTLSIRGSVAPLDWTTGHGMSALADDTWTLKVEADASFEYKPLLDDSTWSIGPNYVAQPGSTVDIYPRFYTEAGTVKQLFSAFHSDKLGNDRVVWVYLPPSYDENTRAKFPVVYMHDGQNLFQSGVLGDNGWKVDDTLNAAALDGSIREVIVVAPENAGTQRIYEYTPTYDASEMAGGGGDLYLGMLTDELKPQVDALLRTQPDRSTTALVGSSLGGLISAYAGVTKPDVYGLIGALSPSTWWDNEMLLGTVAMTGALRPFRVYVDCGDDGTSDDEDDIVETTMLFNTYTSIGYVEGTTFQRFVQPGGRHSEVYWAQRLPGALQFLLGPR
ncbi:MAG: alpha/beta hydrolase-fold protein [Polyangia bacterium]